MDADARLGHGGRRHGRAPGRGVASSKIARCSRKGTPPSPTCPRRAPDPLWPRPTHASSRNPREAPNTAAWAHHHRLLFERRDLPCGQVGEAAPSSSRRRPLQSPRTTPCGRPKSTWGHHPRAGQSLPPEAHPHPLHGRQRGPAGSRQGESQPGDLFLLSRRASIGITGIGDPHLLALPRIPADKAATSSNSPTSATAATTNRRPGELIAPNPHRVHVSGSRFQVLPPTKQFSSFEFPSCSCEFWSRVSSSPLPPE